MAYILDGTTIKNPHQLEEKNSTQVAVQRTLSGSIRRDYFGSNKRVWTFEYTKTKKADYDTIKAIYDSYLSTGNTKVFSSTELNNIISATNVHIDLQQRSFVIGGTDYLSDFVLILTEA